VKYSDTEEKLIVADLDWTIDEDGDDCADGVEYEYVIDLENELAVFKNGKVVAIRRNGCMSCAESMGNAIEETRLRQIRDSKPERLNMFNGDGAWICDGQKHGN